MAVTQDDTTQGAVENAPQPISPGGTAPTTGGGPAGTGAPPGHTVVPMGGVQEPTAKPPVRPPTMGVQQGGGTPPPSPSSRTYPLFEPISMGVVRSELTDFSPDMNVAQWAQGVAEHYGPALSALLGVPERPTTFDEQDELAGGALGISDTTKVLLRHDWFMHSPDASTVIHELTHQMLGARGTYNGVPTWIQEGLADWVAAKVGLAGPMSRQPDPTAPARAGYEGSASFFEYLDKMYPGSMKKFTQAVQGDDFNNRTTPVDVFGKSWDDLVAEYNKVQPKLAKDYTTAQEEAWREHMQARTLDNYNEAGGPVDLYHYPGWDKPEPAPVKLGDDTIGDNEALYNLMKENNVPEDATAHIEAYLGLLQMQTGGDMTPYAWRAAQMLWNQKFLAIRDSERYGYSYGDFTNDLVNLLQRPTEELDRMESRFLVTQVPGLAGSGYNA